MCAGICQQDPSCLAFSHSEPARTCHLSDNLDHLWLVEAPGDHSVHIRLKDKYAGEVSLKHQLALQIATFSILDKLLVTKIVLKTGDDIYDDCHPCNVIIRVSSRLTITINGVQCMRGFVILLF